MKKSKKKVIIIICSILAVIIISAGIALFIQFDYPDSRYDAEDIERIHVETTTGYGPSTKFYVESEEGIKTVLECVKDMSTVNTMAKKYRETETAPHSHTFTYTFKDGSTKTFTHVLKPISDAASITRIVELEEVQAQIATD